jgi:hypothetical protein
MNGIWDANTLFPGDNTTFPVVSTCPATLSIVVDTFVAVTLPMMSALSAPGNVMGEFPAITCISAQGYKELPADVPLTPNETFADAWNTRETNVLALVVIIASAVPPAEDTLEAEFPRLHLTEEPTSVAFEFTYHLYVHVVASVFPVK